LIKIELLSGFDVSFWEFLATSATSPLPLSSPRSRRHSCKHIHIPESSNPANPRDPLSRPQIAHDHGNRFSGSEAAHRATT
jgi:hypothetical protein